MSSAPAGYSGTPLVRKLGIAAGHRVLLAGTPAGIAGSAARRRVDVKVCAIDPQWSGLKFVIRLTDRVSP